MPITETDIKLLASARMTDTPDGGGRMTGNVIQSGVDNNIFDDVSALDRVHGNASLRKVFPMVLTNTTDKYLGARVIIDQPPADANVHGLLFDASSLFDTRDAARARVEAYLAVGAAYQGLLYGNHLAGMMTVMLIQQTDRALPTIGQVLVLRKKIDLPGEETQYVRVTAVSSQVLGFTDDKGDFSRRVVTCNISDPLRVPFPGFEATRVDAGLDFTGYTRVFETVVANAAQYYGIRPLAAPTTMGSFAVKADTVYSPLIPSAQIETPIADSRTNNQKGAILPAGVLMRETVSMRWSPTQSLHVGGAIVPNGFAVSSGGIVVHDVGGILYQGGTEVGALNHADGIASLSVDVWGAPATFELVYMPGEEAFMPMQSMAIPITLANRSLSYVVTLVPRPVAATLSATYMAEGNWYTLTDGGDGVLRASDSAVGIGSMNYQSGTCTITLGALPDVGSAVIFTWGESQNTSALSVGNMELNGYAYFPINSDGVATEEKGSKAFAPNSVSVTWTVGGTTFTATDNGTGGLTGDARGTVNYSDGVVLLSPLVLPPAGTMINVSTNRTTRVTSPPVNVNGGIAAPALVPRTVSLDIDLQVMHTVTGVQNVSGTPVSKTVRVIDEPIDASTGNLFFIDGPNGPLVVGTVNYTTGAINVTPGATLPAGLIDMEGVSVTYLGTSGATSNNQTSWSNSSSSAGSYASSAGIYVAPQTAGGSLSLISSS